MGHQQLAAERVKRASVVTAQGHRVQVKTESEGEMQSAITLSKGDQTVNVLRCKGQADSKVRIAKAEAEAIRTISGALREFGVEANLVPRRFEVFTNLAKHC